MAAEEKERGSVTVLGAGGWGTALAVHWARAGLDVLLWAHDTDRLAAIRAAGENRDLLPGVPVPEAVTLTASLDEAVAHSRTLVIAVPSKVVSALTLHLAPFISDEHSLVSAAKGLGIGPGGLPRRMTEAIRDALRATSGRAGVAVISGPSHAEEVGRGLPTTVVVAGDRAESLRDGLSTSALRIYTSPDVIGVELGGALKNPIAIAAGIGIGLGAGDNALGALVTRGIAEITRLGVACGADERTFAGLSGIGDLVATCASPHSRNRRVGIEIAKGKHLDAILRDLGMVAEGVESARVAAGWAERLGVEVPIIGTVNRILFHGADPVREVERLMTRSLKDEF
jgi:glycerol-3-phosphate dehydrogenase (NAD(P)+)